MALSPFLSTLANGIVASAVTETFDIPTRGRSGLILTHIVATASGFSTTVSVLGVDPASGLTWPILTALALTATGTQVLQVGPALTPAANAAASALLPATVRVQVTHTDATAITRTLAYQLVS